MPTVTSLHIGHEAAAATSSFNGYIRQVTYLKRTATDGEMQTLTT